MDADVYRWSNGGVYDTTQDELTEDGTGYFIETRF